MDTGDPFHIVFITADRKRGTGGDIKELDGWKKTTHQREQKLPGDFATVAKSTTTAAPRKTITIFNPLDPSDHAISVHIRTMVFFNHQRITG